MITLLKDQTHAEEKPAFSATTQIFVGLGLLSLIAYLPYNFLIPQSPSYMASPRSLLISQFPFWSAVTQLPIPVPRNGVDVVALLLATVLLCSVCYALALRAGASALVTKATVAVVVGFALVFWLSSVLTLPNFSSDLYIYMSYARVGDVYQANPYIYSPADFVGDPFLQFADWIHTTTPYGPLWTHLSTGWSHIAGENIAAGLLLFRLLFFGFNLANIVLIWKIAERLNPAYRLSALIFYAWNPIVVLKGQSHLEPLIVFFVLMGVYVYLRKWEWLAVVMLTFSVLTKFVTAPLLIIYAAFLWRRKPPSVVATSFLLAGSVVVLFYLPVWEAWGTTWALAVLSISSMTGIALTVGLVGLVVWVSRRKLATMNDMLRSWGIVMLAMSILLTFSHPSYVWYLIPLVGMASIVDAYRLKALTLGLCCSALLANTLEGIAAPYTSFLLEDPFVMLWRVFFWVAPPVLALAWVERASLARFFSRTRLAPLWRDR
ncbi:MAG: hypothetical protein ABI670_04435 [Chloroflexota bacterium]